EFGVAQGGVRVGLPTGTGGEITGLSKPFLDDVYAFTAESINRVRVAGSADITVQTVNSSVGCIAHQSIRQVGNDLFFVSERGVHSLLATERYGDVEQEFLSAPIQRIWNRINPERLRQAWATYWKQRDLYILCIPARGTRGLQSSGNPAVTWYGLDQNFMLVLHVSSRRWALWDFPGTAIAMHDSNIGPGYPVPFV